MNLDFLAAKYFGVDLPVFSTVLKSKFRELSRKLHPDVGGNETAFKDMKAAYDAIQKAGMVIQGDIASSADADKKILRTSDGTPLTELGLGLGPNTNGKDCMECAGRGYRAWEDRNRRIHHQCYGIGCRACKYRGYFEAEAVMKYRKCEACEGKGEIKIYNPVILKGAMSQAQRKRGGK
jgi:DnaJ-class molecular chaperone